MTQTAQFADNVKVLEDLKTALELAVKELNFDQNPDIKSYSVSKEWKCTSGIEAGIKIWKDMIRFDFEYQKDVEIHQEIAENFILCRLRDFSKLLQKLINGTSTEVHLEIFGDEKSLAKTTEREINPGNWLASEEDRKSKASSLMSEARKSLS